MTFALADRWSPGGWSVGADRDEEALAQARERARQEGLAGARFIRWDVEREEFGPLLPGRPPDLITAHLCMSPEIAERAARALPTGGVFAFAALHPDLWREAGRASRFALDEDEAQALLLRHGLVPAFLRVEKEVLRFRDAREAIEGFFRNGEAVPRWRGDGRWDALLAHIRGGGRTVTARAQVQCVARKAPA